MASLHRLKDRPYWYCAFTTADGKRHLKSTKTKLKKQAKEICATWSAASLDGDSLTPEKAAQVIERGVETAMKAVGRVLPKTSIQDWCDTWLETKQAELSGSSYSRYNLGLKSFKGYLGAKASKRLDALESSDIVGFRRHCLKTLSPGSVNTHLRVVRACLNSAMNEGLISSNPATRVKAVDGEESRRKEMTLEDIQKVLETCGDTEWRGLVLVGLYTGQRLGDCASLTWGQVDLVKKTIRFDPKKTRRKGKRLSMHLAKPLEDCLNDLPSSDDPEDYVFPELADRANRSSSSLSNAFAMEVLIPAELMPARNTMKKSEGKGRSGKREVNPITFHSLRHSFVTMLKATGASNAMAQMIVGHDSAPVNRHYTHLDAKDTVTSLNALPDVTKKTEE